MDTAGHELFPGAALSTDENASVSRTDTSYFVAKLLHRLRATEERRPFRQAAQPLDLPIELGLTEAVPHRLKQPLAGAGLLDENVQLDL